MNKIPTLYTRDPADRRFVLPQVSAGAEWVVAGEGTATRKLDGTCVLYDPDLAPYTAHVGALQGWWARREIRPTADPPEHFVKVQGDPATGKWVGWEPAEVSPFARYLTQAVQALPGPPEPGTYELIGPRINRNPEGVKGHQLVRHADADVLDAPRDFEGLRRWLHTHPYEGIVWHHEDGVRMVKIKRRDFPRG